MNLALIGPSGVGKGTHAEKLAARYGMAHLSTGDLFRENLEKRSALGLLARRYMNRGELVPDEVVDAMIEEWVERVDPAQGIIFDGFPRTRYQAEFLEELFKANGRQLDAVIYLQVSDDEVINRLTGRLVCHQCPSVFHSVYSPFQSCAYNKCQGEHLYRRDNLNLDQLRSRLRVFHRVTGAMAYFYQKQGRLVIVDGEGTIEAVQQTLVSTIEALGHPDSPTATLAEIQEIDARKGAALTLAPDQVAEPGLNLVLLGGPGSGKGTQAEQLRTELKLPHIATGDLFRENLKHQTELGQLAKTYMDRGELVPDDVTEAMVQERLSRPDTRRGFILDGFPRTLAQAEALSDMLTSLQRRLSGVLYLNVSDEEIVRRLSGRVICRECQTPFHTDFNPFKRCPFNKCEGQYLYQRDDDNPQTIRARLKTYHGQTTPLVEYYQSAGLLIEVDGEGDLPDITAHMLAAAHSLQPA